LPLILRKKCGKNLGFEGKIIEQGWLKWDEEKIFQDTVEIAVQMNGKLKGVVEVSVNCSQRRRKRSCIWRFALISIFIRTAKIL
jgi:leucyl-tRNA synthetase